MTPKERQAYARAMFAQHPELFPANRRQSILSGVIVEGMTPFEARLAGGAFFYKVIADPVSWSPEADPLEVMWAQSTKPDNSQIRMTFRNTSQFGDDAERAFHVHFECGKAVRIDTAES